MASPTERSFTKRAPLIPPLVSPSRRHPIGGIENEVFSPLQSKVSRGWSFGASGVGGLELEPHAGPPRNATTAMPNTKPGVRQRARIRLFIGIGRQGPEAQSFRP